MATHKVKKVAVETTDIAGLKSSRYEKLQVSYGSIPAASYALGDTLVFSDVPSKDIIRATVVAHTATPVTLEVFPATDLSSAMTLLLPDNATKPKLSYIIEYVRGTGRVGPDAYTSNEYGSGQALESGEGELFSVIVEKYNQLPGATGVHEDTDEEQVPV